MKRTLLTLLIIACSLEWTQAQTIHETITTQAFTKIDASYAYDIEICKGESESIELSCPERIRKYLDISVRNSTLRLKADPPRGFRLDNEEKIMVKVTMKEIKSINLSGASSATSAAHFTTKEFDLSLSGAAEINDELCIHADKFTYSLSGASEAAVNGKFGIIRGHVSGSSELEIKGNSTDIEISCSGASNVTYSGEVKEKTNVICSGASEVELEGSTAEIFIDCSGASEVDAQDMIAQTGSAIAGGASSIRIYGDKKLVLKSSGSSKIRYYGEAKELIQPDNNIQRGK